LDHWGSLDNNSSIVAIVACYLKSRTAMNTLICVLTFDLRASALSQAPALMLLRRQMKQQTEIASSFDVVVGVCQNTNDGCNSGFE